MMTLSSPSAHATCYEKATKLMALKVIMAHHALSIIMIMHHSHHHGGDGQAGNLYWNFNYYDPLRRTITKPLMVLSKRQLREELSVLAYLAMASNRTLIVPNILVGNDLEHHDIANSCEHDGDHDD